MSLRNRKRVLARAKRANCEPNSSDLVKVNYDKVDQGEVSRKCRFVNHMIQFNKTGMIKW